jgi:hypothetical protein
MRMFLGAAAISLCVGLAGASSVSAQALNGLPSADKAVGAALFSQAQYNDNNSYNDNSYHAPHCHNVCYQRDYYNHCTAWHRVCE